MQPAKKVLGEYLGEETSPQKFKAILQRLDNIAENGDGKTERLEERSRQSHFQKPAPRINAPYPEISLYMKHSGNSEAIGRAQEIIDGKRKNPFVLIGPNGSGKTSYISWLMYEFRKKGISSGYLDVDELSEEYQRTAGERFSRLDELKRAGLIAIDSLHKLTNQRPGCQKTLHYLWNHAVYKKGLIFAFTPNTLDFNSFLEQLSNLDLSSRLRRAEQIPITYPTSDREEIIEKFLLIQNNVKREGLERIIESLNQIIPLKSTIGEMEGDIQNAVNGSIRKYGEICEEGVEKALSYLTQKRLFQTDYERSSEILGIISKITQFPVSEIQGNSGKKEVNEIRLATVFALQQLTDLDYREIGGILGRAPSTVKKLYSEAIKSFTETQKGNILTNINHMFEHS
jgi:chromosomal replication initiation ATPase DnaA